MAPTPLALVAGLALASSLFAQQGTTSKPTKPKDPAVEKFKQEQLAKTTAVVHGRCVDGETGKPLAGCTVRFHGWGRNRQARALGAGTKWEDPAPVVTKADGRFEFRFVPLSWTQHTIDVSCSGRYPRTGRWSFFKPDTVDDLGDIKLFPGYGALARVVDEKGQPFVGRLSVSVSQLPLPLGSEPGKPLLRRTGVRVRVGGAPRPARRGNATHMGANSRRRLLKQENGRWINDVPLPAGTFPLGASARGVTLVKPHEITIPKGGMTEPVTIVVKEMPFLSGKVVDENGVPVQRVSIHAQLMRSGRMASGRSGRDGTFKIYRVENSPDEVGLEVFDPADCELATVDGKFKWGTKGILVKLRRALKFELQVVEAGTGKPVERFAVECFPTQIGRRSSLERDARLGGHHKDGKVVVDKVYRGKNCLRIIPNDQKLWVSEYLDFTATEQNPGPKLIEVPRLVPLKVRVVDAKGDPVGGASIEVIDRGNPGMHGREFDVETRVMALRGRGVTMWSSDPNFKAPTLIYSGKTDLGGSLIAYGLKGNDNLAIRVTYGKEQKQKHLQEDVKFGGDKLSLKIRVDGAK